MNEATKLAIKTGSCLAVFTFFSIATILGVDASTKDYVKQAEIARLNSELGKMLPGIEYDNDIMASCREYSDPVLTDGSVRTYYTATKDGKEVGLIIRHLTKQGYSGAIEILTGVAANGEIKKVTITKQTETPGLGDRVMPEKSDWLMQFSGKSLAYDNFAVKKDGGDFTYFTGATVTPRAIVNAEGALLRYLQNNNTIKDSRPCGAEE